MSSCACVLILVGGIERFVVLEGVESMAEQLKLDNDTRDRLKQAEAYIRFLSAKVDKFPTGADTGSFLPNNYYSRLAQT